MATEIYFSIEPPDLQTHMKSHVFFPKSRGPCSYEQAHYGEFFKQDKEPQPIDVECLSKGIRARGILSVVGCLDEGVNFQTIIFVSGHYSVEAAIWGNQLDKSHHHSRSFVRETGAEGSIMSYYRKLRPRFNVAYRTALENVLKERGIWKANKK